MLSKVPTPRTLRLRNNYEEQTIDVQRGCKYTFVDNLRTFGEILHETPTPSQNLNRQTPTELALAQFNL